MVLNRQVTLGPGPGGDLDNVIVTLRADGLALEGIETANLTLNPSAALPENVFLSPATLTLEIVDLDGKSHGRARR